MVRSKTSENATPRVARALGEWRVVNRVRISGWIAWSQYERERRRVDAEGADVAVKRAEDWARGESP